MSQFYTSNATKTLTKRISRNDNVDGLTVARQRKVVETFDVVDGGFVARVLNQQKVNVDILINFELYLCHIVTDLDTWTAVHRSQFDDHVQSLTLLFSTTRGCLEVVGEEGANSECHYYF